MIDFTFSLQLLVRTPAESFAKYFKNNQFHLDNPQFRAAVYLASPIFYYRLEQAAFQFINLNSKEQTTLRKYINRYCFRPTPFGLFSGISLISWGPGKTITVSSDGAGEIVLSPEQNFVLNAGKTLLEQELAGLECYETNPTLYRLQQEYRFISTSIDEQNNSRRFLLQSLGFSSVLRHIAIFCAVPKKCNAVIMEICRLANCEAEDGTDYFNFLRDEQFLLIAERPNITGKGYLERLLNKISLAEKDSARSRRLSQLIQNCAHPHWVFPEYLKNVNAEMSALFPSPSALNTPNQLNAIYNRKQATGELSVKVQNQIRDGIFVLSLLCTEEGMTGMKQFVKSFQKDFEGQSLPLLYALDPEVGIGYDFPQPEKGNPLLETLHIAAKPPTDDRKSWTRAHSLLLDQWHLVFGSGATVIDLTGVDLLRLNPDHQDAEFLGASVLFRLAGEKVFIESGGGVNSPALMGRFTIADTRIADAARDIALQQEAMNPDIIFGEILHRSSPHLDNVNVRETAWSYEIPVTASSTFDKERQLALSDLRVFIRHQQVILYSDKHQKIVVPRLTSAYNHSLDKLPLFRFLADLSYQYGRSNFTLDLTQMFPGLSFYPRVIFKETILHPATWIISSSQIKLVSVADPKETLREFKKMAAIIRLPEVFSFTEGDQQLVFFRDMEPDILFFADCVRQKNEAILKEFFWEEPAQVAVKNGPGEGLIGQYNAFLLPAQPLKIADGVRFPAVRKQIKRRLAPGSDWLYLKIYTSRIGTKRLLLKIIPLLRRRYPTGQLKKWFFVRYEDHAPHIRLRMQIAPPDIADILIAFKEKLEDGISQHVIREYQVDVYSRELERYEAAGMEISETFFWASSEIAVWSLKPRRHLPPVPPFLLAFRTVMEMIAVFLPEKNRQLAFTEAGYQLFIPEFKEKQLRAEMDKKYRELAVDIRQAINDSGFYGSTEMQKAANKFKESLFLLSNSLRGGHDQTDEYLRSIIHMHLNRIFTDDSRKQEMLVYYLLHKYLRSEIARNKTR